MLRDDMRVQQALTAHGLRALIATTAENVRYLTDYESPGLYIYRYHGTFAIALPRRDPVRQVRLALPHPMPLLTEPARQPPTLPSPHWGEGQGRGP